MSCPYGCWILIQRRDGHIPYGSTNKIPYSSIDQVDRDIIEIKTLGSKGFFYLCNNFFVITDIVFTCEQQQRFILKPIDTSYTHAHEVNFYLHVFEELENKQNKHHALALFQRNLELALGGNCIIQEEAQDDTCDGPIKGDKYPSTFLVDEYCINFNLVHKFSSYALPITTMAHEDDNQVKGFFLLVRSEEKEASTLINGDVTRAQYPYQRQHRNPLPIFDYSIHIGDCMTNARELSHWECVNEKSTKFQSGPNSCSICSSMA